MNRVRLLAACVMAASMGLAGCSTTLSSSTPPVTGRASGVAYELPVLNYQFEIERVLTACPEGEGDALAFDAKVSAVEELGPGATVVIDHEELGDAFRTVDASFARHPGGMLKSFNATVDGKAGDFGKAAARSVVGLGKLAMGVAIPPLGVASNAPAPEIAIICSDIGAQRVKTLDDLKGKMEKASKDATKATGDLTAFDADHVLDAPRSEATNTARAELASTVREKGKLLESATKLYTSQKALLSFTRPLRYAPNPDDPTGRDQIDASNGDFFAQNLQAAYYLPKVAGQERKVLYFPVKRDLTLDPADQPAAARASQKVLDQVLIDTAIVAVTTPLKTTGTSDLTQQTACGAGEKPRGCGIIYLSGGAATTKVCINGVDGKACASRLTGDSLLLYSQTRTIPQFARQMSLSLKNGAWSNNTLSATFTADGQLETASYKKANAEAVGMIGTLNEGIDAATELAVYQANEAVRLSQRAETRDKAALAALNASEALGKARDLAALQRQTAYDKALAEQRSAADALVTSELEQAKGDTELLVALKAKVDAEKALKAAQSPD